METYFYITYVFCYMLNTQFEIYKVTANLKLFWSIVDKD